MFIYVHITAGRVKTYVKGIFFENQTVEMSQYILHNIQLVFTHIWVVPDRSDADTYTYTIGLDEENLLM